MPRTNAAPTRIALPDIGPGIYLLKDAPRPWSRGWTFYGDKGATEGDEISVIHVVSAHAGGEVRGYTVHRGQLRLRLPAYPGKWPEVDAAVSVALGIPMGPLPPLVDAAGTFRDMPGAPLDGENEVHWSEGA